MTSISSDDLMLLWCKMLKADKEQEMSTQKDKPCLENKKRPEKPTLSSAVKKAAKAFPTPDELQAYNSKASDLVWVNNSKKGVKSYKFTANISDPSLKALEPTPIASPIYSNSITGASMEKGEAGAFTIQASSPLTENAALSQKKKPAKYNPKTNLDDVLIVLSPQVSSSSLSKDKATLNTATSPSTDKKKKKRRKHYLKLKVTDLGSAIWPPIKHKMNQAYITVQHKEGKLQLQVVASRDKATFKLMNNAEAWEKQGDWANPVYTGQIGFEKGYKTNKKASARLAEMSDGLQAVLNAYDALVGESYDQDGKPKKAYHEGNTATAFFVDVNKAKIVKGIPIHCKCGLHKTKNGTTCLDLYNAMNSARSMVYAC